MSLRIPPTEKLLEIPFTEESFFAKGLIEFQANNTYNSGPKSHITVESGRRGTWIVQFILKQNAPKGSKIGFKKVENEYRFAWNHQNYWPSAMDYVTVEDQNGQELPFECETAQKGAIPAIVELNRDFKANEKIILRMGDQRQGGRGCYVWPNAYKLARIQLGVKLPEDDGFRKCPDANVSVTVTPCPPIRRYHFFAGSTAKPGKFIRAVALPVDINNNPMKPPENIEIKCPDTTELIVNIDESRIEVFAKFNEKGIFRLKLKDKVNNIQSISNPIKVSNNYEFNHYWGEFHWHGWDSVELNQLNDDTHPEKAYRYGMDMTRLDFSASGSHGFPQQPEAVGKWWELYRQAAQKYDKPGKYVPFLGFEWTHLEPDGGDRNVIFKKLDVPQPDPSWPIDKLHKYCSDRDILMTPHVGGSVATPIYHSPQSEKFVEMVSGHGNFEWFAQSYLQKGYKTGLAGGSDGHKATPGHPRSVGMEGGRFVFTLRKRDSGFVGGPIFAVQADQLTRNSLWEGFNKKRVYATTGARAIVDFRINDQPMGSELKANSDINIKMIINGTAKIERVDIIRNDKTLKTFYPGILDWTAEFEDLPLKGQNYYYIRILQEDEEMIWSSPIWVESNCGGSNAGLADWNQEEEVILSPDKSKEAKKYLPLLLNHLKAEENYAMIKDLTPYKVVKSPLANYAVFLCKIRMQRVRIHVFYEFELPRFRFEPAWSLYGRKRFMRSEWAKPLFETQTNLTRLSD